MHKRVINKRETALNLYKLRQKSGLTVRELQKLLEFNSPTTIYKWEAGKMVPNLTHSFILAEIYKCSIDDLFVIERRKDGDS